MITVDPADAKEWQNVPADDIGYLDSAELLNWSDLQLQDLVNRVEINRYQGWRNHRGLWMSELLRMERRHGLTVGAGDGLEEALVLDYGCGLGVEALQYARAGADVILADIAETNLLLASRVLRVMGQGEQLAGTLLVGRDEFASRLRLDVIHCAGVLHHIREPRPVMEWFAALLRPGGQLRLMLYSDEGWRIAANSEPGPALMDDAARQHFIRFFDGVGHWADWYDEAKLVAEFGDLFTIVRVTYLTPDRRYLAAILEPR